MIKIKIFYKTYTLTLIITVLIWWVSEYYILNNYPFFYKNTPYFFNNLLSNPLNKYHPILFFTSYIFFYNVSVYTNFFINYRFFSKLKRVQDVTQLNYFFKNNLYWLIILFSLYLGSWWAIQEGSWGGWWNWDASEVFGLVILTLLLLIFHSKTTLNCYVTRLRIMYMFSLTVLFTYLILQMSYTLVSHNFGLSILSYGYVNMTFLIMLYIVILTYVLSVYLLRISLITTINKLSNVLCKNIKKSKYTYFTLTHNYVLSTMLIVFIGYIYIMSFNPIINNIFWTSLNMEVLNSVYVIFNLKTITIIVILLFLFQNNSLVLFINIIHNFMYSIQYVTVIFFSLNNPSLVKIIHTSIILVTFLSISVSNVAFVNWESLSESVLTSTNSYYRVVFRNNYLLENAYIIISLLSTKSANIFTPNSFFWFSNNLDTQFFELDLSSTLLRQVIYNHTHLYPFKVSIWDSTPLIVDLLATLTVPYFLYFYIFKLKIIF
jgi:cytochrome c biogenesis factor